MTPEELGESAAFPCAMPKDTICAVGLTKREYIATELAAALIQRNGFKTYGTILATTSIEYADILLAKLAGK